MVLKSIGVFSMARMMGTLYALIGLFFGIFFALFAMVGAGFAGEGAGFAGMMFGVGAVIILPLFYGVLAFIMGALISALYNVIAGMVGGIELNLE